MENFGNGSVWVEGDMLWGVFTLCRESFTRPHGRFVVFLNFAFSYVCVCAFGMLVSIVKWIHNWCHFYVNIATVFLLSEMFLSYISSTLSSPCLGNLFLISRTIWSASDTSTQTLHHHHSPSTPKSSLTSSSLSLAESYSFLSYHPLNLSNTSLIPFPLW